MILGRTHGPLGDKRHRPFHVVNTVERAHRARQLTAGGVHGNATGGAGRLGLQNDVLCLANFVAAETFRVHRVVQGGSAGRGDFYIALGADAVDAMGVDLAQVRHAAGIIPARRRNLHITAGRDCVGAPMEPEYAGAPIERARAVRLDGHGLGRNLIPPVILGMHADGAVACARDVDPVVGRNGVYRAIALGEEAVSGPPGPGCDLDIPGRKRVRALPLGDEAVGIGLTGSGNAQFSGLEGVLGSGTRDRYALGVSAHNLNAQGFIRGDRV